MVYVYVFMFVAVGMLLEMDSETLSQVLKDRSLLELAVQRAQGALEAHAHTHSSE